MAFLTNAKGLSHDYALRLIQKGDTVIDATMGNGKDTLFLCELVGEEGCVHAFDVQETALERTKEKVEKAGYSKIAHLHLCGHEQMEKMVEGPVSCVLFNLGYLPSSDKQVTTLCETTLLAVDAALRLLKKGGLLLICIYPGHAEGEKERKALLNWAEKLPQQRANVLYCAFSNQIHDAPSLLVVQKEGCFS